MAETNKKTLTLTLPKLPKIRFPKISPTLGANMLLPMSIVFLAVCLSSSLIISSSILSKGIKDAGINVSNISGAASTNTTGTTTTTTTTTAAAPVSLDQVKNIFNGDYIKFGDASKKALIIEFSDPSCPFCHIAAGKNPELNKQVGDRFKLVSDGGTYVSPVIEAKKLVEEGKASFAWIYANGHGNGEMGTLALYCANEKGKFWEAHDLLMSNAGYNLQNNDVKNDRSKSQQVADFLKDAVPAADMKSCIDSGKFNGRLTSDMALANAFTFQGTPMFLVNTQKYDGAYSYTDMKPTIDDLLK